MQVTTTPGIEGARITGDCGIGADLHYEVLGQASSMLMVSASGTAVVVAPGA